MKLKLRCSECQVFEPKSEINRLKISGLIFFSVFQFKGYVLRITGGNDKQGFPMKQVKREDNAGWGYSTIMNVTRNGTGSVVSFRCAPFKFECMGSIERNKIRIKL